MNNTEEDIESDDIATDQKNVTFPVDDLVEESTEDAKTILPVGDLIEQEVTLRLIDQKIPEVIEEAPEEEKTDVVRLEKSFAPAVDLSKKVEHRRDRDFLNTMMADVGDGIINPDDQDAQWIREAAISKTRAVPMGWFILLILIFGGVFFWGAIQILNFQEEDEGTVSKKNGDEDGTLDFLLEQSLTREQENAERISADQRYLAMEKTIQDYLSSAVVEKKAKYVRHRERVLPFMKDYYARHELEVQEYESVSEYHIVSLENHPFIAIRAELKNGESLALLLEDDGNEFKIDWESEVAYQPYPYDAFIKDRPLGSHEMRVYVQKDRYYAYEYRDEEKWACFKLTSRGSDEYLFGYVERGSLLETEIFKATNGTSRTGSAKTPLFLSVSYAAGGRGPRTVKIEKIISNRWAYATNPEKN